MFFWYKFLTYLLYPFANIYLLLRKLNKKEHLTRYKEKLSSINVNRGKGFLVWFHVASVGEGLSILPLIENIEKEEKVNKILITTITLSAAEVLQKKLLKNKKTIHQFLPLDVPLFVKKFLDHWSPNLSIFVDSEIWPNLIFQIKKKNIPLILVNARITKKTYRKWKMLKGFSNSLFKCFDLCFVANGETEVHLKDLGSKNIKNYGNLKFANTEHNLNNFLDENYLNKIKDRKIWCGASTHSSEEIICAKAHKVIRKNHESLLTIIIPRHIHRVKKIKSDLEKMNLKICLYSDFNKINDNIDILLVDAYGETSKFFQIAKNVFLGGSLIKHGGQNPIEPSRLGCKIFHGPNVENFLEIYEYLKSLKIANLIHDSEDLAQSILNELKLKQDNSVENIEKIDNYGQTILNNVIKDLKKYINV